MDNWCKEFWVEYRRDLQNGYFKLVDNKKALKPEFIVEYPQKIARQLNGKKNKSSQLWKFYEHVKKVQNSLRQRGESLEVVRAELYELRPAVNYAMARDVVTSEFKKFIEFNVQSINDDEDLSAFIKHFQSVIAYLPRQNQD